MNIKNQKGITLMAEVITVILFFVILGTISYSSVSSFQVRSLNNMYADILSIQEKAANYYLKYGEAPIGSKVLDNQLLQSIEKNPNDQEGEYYKIDFDQKLINLSLNNKQTIRRYYFINAKTLTVYYSEGVKIDGLNSGTTEIHYTLPSNYTDVNKIDVLKYQS